jgi:hypothetical protein
MRRITASRFRHVWLLNDVVRGPYVRLACGHRHFSQCADIGGYEKGLKQE